MLSSHGFDLWSDTYDDSVKKADENNEYPFAGYTRLMNAIYGTIMNQSPAKVLDIGCGTARLTSTLYNAGNEITGIDFSAEMIKVALSKMPTANLLQWDFTLGLPSALSHQTFDYIVSTYALHHLTDEAKANFIVQLLEVLDPQGAILIGDVCFRTRNELLACKEACGKGWDNDEFYFVFSEIHEELSKLCRLDFHEFSFCSGVIEIRHKQVIHKNQASSSLVSQRTLPLPPPRAAK
jgi:putative AdoMet-dependent methyltransferase